MTTVVEIEASGHQRRERYKDREDGRVDVITETMTKGGNWRNVGHEIVDTVSVSCD